MSRNAEDCENSGSLPQLESEPEVEQIGEVSEEVPFEIPNKWKWTTLGEMGKWQAGGTPARSNLNFFRRGNIPWLKTGDLNDSEIKEVAEYITEEAIKNSSAHVNPIGSVLMAMYGATIGKLGILTFPCATNQACCACVVNENFVDKWYLFFYLLSQRTKFIALGAGGAQPNISRKKIVGYLIPLPPLAEQRRIVARLNELLPLVDDFGEAQEAFEVTQTEFPGKLKDSLLQVTIEGKLVPQLESEPEVEQIGEAPEEVPFEIPNKWKWVRFQDVGSFISGWTPKAEELQKVCNKGCVPYFKIADMNQQGNEIWLQKTSSFLKKSERTRTFFRGTIVYPKNGGAVFTNKRRLLNQESVVDLNTGGYVPGKFLDIGYAYNIFLGLDFRTISKGTALPTLDQTKLRNYFIPLPPLAEQRRIVARVNELLSLLDELH